MSDILYQAGIIAGYLCMAFLPPYLLFLIYLYFSNTRSKYKLLTGFRFDMQEEFVVSFTGEKAGLLCERRTSGEREMLLINPELMRCTETNGGISQEKKIPLRNVFRLIQLKQKASVFLVLTGLFGAWTLLQIFLLHYADTALIFSFTLFFFLMYRESQKTVIRIETTDLRYIQYYYRKKQVEGGEHAVQAAIEYVNRLIKESKEPAV